MPYCCSWPFALADKPMETRQKTTAYVSKCSFYWNFLLLFQLFMLLFIILLSQKFLALLISGLGWNLEDLFYKHSNLHTETEKLFLFNDRNSCLLWVCLPNRFKTFRIPARNIILSYCDKSCVNPYFTLSICSYPDIKYLIFRQVSISFIKYPV